MFTGIITSIGTIIGAQAQGDLRLDVACGWPVESLHIGESIACNGACLTVVERAAHTDGAQFTVTLSQETLDCTAPRWKPGGALNLERALKMGDALDGHLVTGHVDGLAQVESISADGDSRRLVLEAPEALARFIAAKGSVTLDGVSLTVNSVDGRRFGVNIIPHTWQMTTLGMHRAGDVVNMEVDLIARYVARLMGDEKAGTHEKMERY